MGVDQYERLRSLFEANAPWCGIRKAGAHLPRRGNERAVSPCQDSHRRNVGRDGTIGEVASDTPWNFLVMTGVTGSFQAEETVTDNSVPAKSASLTSVEAFGTYNVEVLSLDGKLFEEIGTNMPYRKDIRMRLLVLGPSNGPIP